MNLIGSTSTSIGISNASGTTTHLQSLSEWSEPKMVDVIDTGSSIEMTFVQNRNIDLWGGWSQEKRVFKIVYSCVNGMWNKSKPVYGKIIPAQEEYYDFEQ
jgi:hypothetical protein